MTPSGKTSHPPSWRWSISRSHLLRNCGRAFEFQLGVREVTSDRSSLVNLSALTGIAIHDAISSEMDRWASGRNVSERGAISKATNYLEEVWNRRSEKILEARNGLEIEPSLIEAYRRVVRSRLERFFEMLWPQFSSMRHESHEKLESFRGCALQVAVKIDLSCWNDRGQLVIADWKTGGWQNLIGGRFQLAVYALWAHTELRLPLDKILPTLVSLQTGEVAPFQPTEHDLEFVRREVELDRDRVRGFLKEGKFPASPQPEKCWGCAFLPTCDEGSEVVGLRDKVT